MGIYRLVESEMPFRATARIPREERWHRDFAEQARSSFSHMPVASSATLLSGLKMLKCAPSMQQNSFALRELNNSGSMKISNLERAELWT